MTAADFVDRWAAIWDRHDGDGWPALLAPGAELHNPLGTVGRDELPGYMKGLVESVPDHRLRPTRWGETQDGVLIEWVMTGSFNGRDVEVHGVDRFTLADGVATEGHAYFDPREIGA